MMRFLKQFKHIVPFWRGDLVARDSSHSLTRKGESYHFKPVSSGTVAGAVFDAFIDFLVEQTQQAGHLPVTLEKGKTLSGQGYLFASAYNQSGLLIQQHASGWSVSQARKIHGQDMFIRSDEVIENGLVYNTSENKSIYIQSRCIYPGEFVPKSMYFSKFWHVIWKEGHFENA